MENTYEINTNTNDNTAIELSRFIADDVPTETAMEIMMELHQNGFRITEDGRHFVKAWGSIANNEVISVNYILMGTLPYPEEEVPCVRYNYHREEWPGYEMIDHTEDFSGGATWEGFKRKFKLKETVTVEA